MSNKKKIKGEGSLDNSRDSGFSGNSEEREKKVWELLEKYNVDLSLGAEDLYIGVKRETGLWFEEHI